MQSGLNVAAERTATQVLAWAKEDFGDVTASGINQCSKMSPWQDVDTSLFYRAAVVLASIGTLTSAQQARRLSLACKARLDNNNGTTARVRAKWQAEEAKEAFLKITLDIETAFELMKGKRKNSGRPADIDVNRH